jgi:Lon-like protease
VIYPPDQSQQQVDQENQQDFKNSQNSATLAALRELGYQVHVTVKELPSGSPATGRLQPGDELTSVNGQPVTSAGRLTALVRSKPVGTALSIGYLRSGAAGSTTVTTIKGQDGNPRMGVTIDQQQASPYKITISLDNVGGPSAGLMFSLGIIDKLDPQDLTGGLKIAGTGTIDDDGRVGAIGGIPQKMRAAKRDGATIFLVPSDNCAEAVANAVPGLELVDVGTLDQALTGLKTLRGHGTPTLCRRR